MRTATLLPAAFLLVATAVQGQTTVTHIVGPTGDSLVTTDLAVVIRLGSFGPDPLSEGLELDAGDELHSATPELIVEVSCGEAVTMELDAPFRATVMPSEKSCFLDLAAGAAHVQGDNTSGLGAGDVVLGSEGTRYALRVVREGEEVVRQVELFEGALQLRAAGGATVRQFRDVGVLEVQPGISPAEWRTRALSEREVGAAATIFTRVDASRVPRAERPAAQERLLAGHRAVLARPDPATREELLSIQLRYRAASDASRYHLNHLQPSEAPQGESELERVVLQQAVYAQIGDQRRAEELSRRLQTRYNPREVNMALESLGIVREAAEEGGVTVMRTPTELALNPAVTRTAEAVPPPILEVAVVANPPAVETDGAVRIVVSVVDGQGQPVEGAAIALAARGGDFGRGRTAVRSRTDAQGLFTLAWRCGGCGPEAVVQAEATLEGYRGGEASVRIRVR